MQKGESEKEGPKEQESCSSLLSVAMIKLTKTTWEQVFQLTVHL